MVQYSYTKNVAILFYKIDIKQKEML